MLAHAYFRESQKQPIFGTSRPTRWQARCVGLSNGTAAFFSGRWARSRDLKRHVFRNADNVRRCSRRVHDRRTKRQLAKPLRYQPREFSGWVRLPVDVIRRVARQSFLGAARPWSLRAQEYPTLGNRRCAGDQPCKSWNRRRLVRRLILQQGQTG